MLLLFLVGFFDTLLFYLDLLLIWLEIVGRSYNFCWSSAFYSVGLKLMVWNLDMLSWVRLL